MKRRPSPVHGVLVVDKPRGPTSHDVVRLARRAFGTRSVGHAGTLDPMATGVLVLAVGEATKLVPWLTADDKAYEATIRLGVETDTLDAEGAVVSERPPATWPDQAAVQAAAAAFLGTIPQQVPKVSAVRVDGQRLHDRARRGEEFEAPIRDVVAHRIEVRDVRGEDVHVALDVGKGFYVRAFARDLAARLGTVGHLRSLRRTRSGAHEAATVVPGDLLAAAAAPGADAEPARAALRRRLLRPLEAWAGRPVAHLGPAGTAHAHHGRPVPLDDVARREDGKGDAVGLVDPSGRLVAVARAGEGGALHVVRGLRYPDAAPAPDAGASR